MKAFKRWLLLRVSTFIIWLFHKTYRYEPVQAIYQEEVKKLSPHGNCAYATWHNNSFAGILAHAKVKICVMVSRSLDGDFMAFLAKKLGMSSVRGSSSKGGREALSELVDEVNEGWSAAFAVDGPRGPLKSVKAGVISLAAKTGTPILPLCAFAENHWVLHKSWDQFRVPKPFSRVAVVYGEPIRISGELSDEEFAGTKELIYQRLEDLEKVAQKHFARA